MKNGLGITNMNGLSDNDKTCGLNDMNCLSDAHNKTCGLNDMNCIGEDEDKMCGLNDMNCIGN